MKIAAAAYQNIPPQTTLILPLYESDALREESIFLSLPRAARAEIQRFAEKEFFGERGEAKLVLYGPHQRARAVLLGLGKKSDWNERTFQLLPRLIVRTAQMLKIKHCAIPLPYRNGIDRRTTARLFATGALMAQFTFNQYKEKPKGGWPTVQTLVHLDDKKNLPVVRHGLREGTIIGEEVNAARILANTPGGDMTPRVLAAAARSVARKTGITAKILDEQSMKKIGMGAILGVARGSKERPRFIILEYCKGPRGQKPLVLIGKGVTFDTGGLNLKPEHGIYEMHMDMAGGAAVIHGIAAIARLQLPIHVVGLIPAVENMPSGTSYRPGDILKSLSGKTIEVLNTDAEGRVILADALTYGLRYKPGFMADFATLTGAAHVALGDYASVIFTNTDALTESLVRIGKMSGDLVWPLPLWDEYLQDIKGTFGDLANVGKKDRAGGAVHGAKFLEQFVGGIPWAHIDIAPRMTAHEYEYLSKGATGVGVRYIVELARWFRSNLQL